MGRLISGKNNSSDTMNKIILQNITVDGSLVQYSFSVNEELKKYFTTDVMFLRYEQSMADVPISILSIPFVNCMAGFSWLTGAMLFVDEIDETYYYALKQLKVAYSELHRTNLQGTFVPSVIKKNEIDKSSDCLLLFGGGVDCHSSYLRNRERVSGIINIYGWSKGEEQRTAVDISDQKMAEEFAHRFDIESYHVTSNFASQFNLSEIDKVLTSSTIGTTYWYGFLHPMAFLSISAPIAWMRGCSTLMIASSFTKDRADVHCGSFITTDSEFRFATNGITIHDGFELNRQDKVAILVNYQRESRKPYAIQACSFNDHNCCTCEKCFRTVVELVAENADPKDFGFNIEGPIVEHWKTIVHRDVALWAATKEDYYYYYFARKRMRENYDNIQDREFVDWFLNFDFDKERKKGLWRYYRKNFFSILKRKMKL